MSVTWRSEWDVTRVIVMTVITRNATPLKSTRSKTWNSDLSVSRGTNSNWDFGLMWICTQEFEVRFDKKRMIFVNTGLYPNYSISSKQITLYHQLLLNAEFQYCGIREGSCDIHNRALLLRCRTPLQIFGAPLLRVRALVRPWCWDIGLFREGSCDIHKDLSDIDIPYGVATISRLLKIIGLFCRISPVL